MLHQKLRTCQHTVLIGSVVTCGAGVQCCTQCDNVHAKGNPLPSTQVNLQQSEKAFPGMTCLFCFLRFTLHRVGVGVDDKPCQKMTNRLLQKQLLVGICARFYCSFHSIRQMFSPLRFLAFCHDHIFSVWSKHRMEPYVPN